MPVQSMTGFARHEATAAGGEFVWELRSVNSKGLDLRLRLPQGFETIENDLRREAATWLTRGNIQANLQIRRDEAAPAFTINEPMLGQLLALSSRLVADGHAAPPSADGILAIKGIVEVAESRMDPDTRDSQFAAARESFSAALASLAGAREAEGAALADILSERLAEIERLAGEAEADPSRSPHACRDRLTAQVAELMTADDRLDEQRLHQEAAMIAARADIREEIDRLQTHVAAAKALLAAGGPVGRRLDFLSQELNRESNTICSKSNATSLTAIGLELKVAVDQFREQVQNIE
ncbi:YicC/YloC family endoribonuclease [Aurantimonas sp. A2-1-M11]|uniref:YicC/YloC family endoribonuclease n=1 Tax=Aurantimonas sp. A2-1-M11 TaxID=3113712 RepID=UPI002F92F002